MAPIVDGLQRHYGETITVRRINAIRGDGPAIMRNYRIQGHPATLVFDAQGHEVQRWLGPQSEEAIKKVLDRVIEPER